MEDYKRIKIGTKSKGTKYIDEVGVGVGVDVDVKERAIDVCVYPLYRVSRAYLIHLLREFFPDIRLLRSELRAVSHAVLERGPKLRSVQQT